MLFFRENNITIDDDVVGSQAESFIRSSTVSCTTSQDTQHTTPTDVTMSIPSNTDRNSSQVSVNSYGGIPLVVSSNDENFSQSQLSLATISIDTQGTQQSSQQFVGNEKMTSSGSLRIMMYTDEEFVKCNEVLPSNFWEVGFESLHLYDKLVAGCVGF